MAQLPGYSGICKEEHLEHSDSDYLLASVAKWIVANDANGAKQTPEQREAVEEIKQRMTNLKGKRGRGFAE